MRRTASRLRTDLASRLDRLEHGTPEWGPWLDMLREVGKARLSSEWAAAIRLDERARHADTSPDAPLLQDRTVEVTTKPFLRLAKRLTKTELDDEEDVLALMESTMRGVSTPGAAGRVGELLVGLALSAVREQLAAPMPAGWPHGYCPFCGSWPVMAELRGMDRARRLRCGRCAADWQMVWLRCAYCGEAEHDRLVRLEPEAGRESRFVDACGTCRHYLKSVSTLTPLGPMDLVLRDLETVELDVAALEHGYRRPDDLGFPVNVRVVASAKHA